MFAGIDHNTPALAVESIVKWGKQTAQKNIGDAKSFSFWRMRVKIMDIAQKHGNRQPFKGSGLNMRIRI